MKQMTRREWLGRGLAGVALLGLGGLLLDVWLSARRFSSARWRQMAGLENLPGDGTYPFPDLKTALIVSSGRVAAVSLECTHLGCLVNATDDGFFCPCHGSEFGPRGEVYSGPAQEPLPWYPVEVRKGSVWFHSGTKKGNPEWVSIHLDPETEKA